jgi:hypothetical protein
MKTPRKKPSLAPDGKHTAPDGRRESFSRRKFMTVSAAFGATIMTGKVSASAQQEYEEDLCHPAHQ